MKKSKIIIPAFGILALSTAASITGTVAWFTANRKYTYTVGDFAVVNTKDNLSCTLGAGIGTSVDNTTNAVTVTDGYVLTDASFDHTSTSSDIIIPDDAGEKVGRVVALANAELGTAATGNAMFRETNIYSAFTWTMTFDVVFSASANKKMGLYFDLSSSDTWTHEKVTLVEGDTIAASTLYPNADLSGDPLAAGTVTAGQAGNTYYKAAPDDTGKGFRIAFVPTTIPTGSYGYTKVWAPHQTVAKSQFVDGLAVNAELAATDYGTATISKTGSTVAAAAAGSGKVLMANGSTSAIPSDGTHSSSTALSGADNYLGYFGVDAGNSVSLTFTCVAWYEGTDENITNDKDTLYEIVTSSLTFGVAKLSD